LHIDFDISCTGIERALDGGECVFRIATLPAAVGDEVFSIHGLTL
jgi:hypothetical protein